MKRFSNSTQLMQIGRFTEFEHIQLHLNMSSSGSDSYENSNIEFGEFDDVEQPIKDYLSRQGSANSLVDGIRDMEIEDNTESSHVVVRAEFGTDNVLDDDSRFKGNDVLTPVTPHANEGKGKVTVEAVCEAISLARGGARFDENMINNHEKVTGGGQLRQSNLRIVANISKSFDIKALSKSYTLHSDVYSKTVVKQGYAQLLRDGSIGHKNTPVANITYKYHDVPTSAKLIMSEELAGLKVRDAVRKVLLQGNGDRVHTSIKEFVRSLERCKPFDFKNHIHQEASLVKTTDEPFCDTCAIRFFLKEFLSEMKIVLSVPFNDTGLGFSAITTVTICHGILLYGLLLCRGRETEVSWDQLAYAPHHVVSTLAKSFLADRLNLKYEPSSGCEMLKSATPMDFHYFQRRLLISCFIDFWRLVSYAVKEVRIDDGVMSLNVPKIFKRESKSDENASEYHMYEVSKPLLRRYASYKPEASAFMPLLKLFIDGEDAMSQTGIYGEICKYAIAYFTALIKNEFTSSTYDVITHCHKASNFLLHGSFKVSGLNNGILLIEVIKKYDQRFGRFRHYDKYFNFCLEADNVPLVLGESIVDQASILALISPLLLNVLNDAVLDFLNAKMSGSGKVNLTWCFEYGGHAIFCSRGDFVLKGGEEVKELSENVIDMAVPNDGLALNWVKMMDEMVENTHAKLLELRTLHEDVNSEIKTFDLLKQLLRINSPYSINVLDHNIAVSLVNERIDEEYRRGEHAHNERRPRADNSSRNMGARNIRGAITLDDFPVLSGNDRKQLKDANKKKKNNNK